MSLKDLLPEGTYDEIVKEANDKPENKRASGPLVRCPMCKKEIVYDTNNPFRPFCSEKCRILDLGEWATNNRAIKGKSILDDEDGELLSKSDTPKYNHNDDY